jgi:hypothetical protein
MRGLIQQTDVVSVKIYRIRSGRGDKFFIVICRLRLDQRLPNSRVQIIFTLDDDAVFVRDNSSLQ